MQLPHPHQDRFCRELYGVFTPDECAAMIERAEALGFVPAEVAAGPGGQQVLMENYRRSGRVMMDDLALAQEIFDRIKDETLPQVGKGASVRILSSLNPRLRFLRYEQGDYFAPHFDDCRKHGRERSFLTMMLYLNEDFEGGSTAFLGHEGARTAFVPKTGSVLLFEHKLEHEGCTVMSGVKYCIRSDVMYARPLPQAITPRVQLEKPAENV